MEKTKGGRIMVKHIVFFKLKDRSPESIAKARDLIMSMKGKIPFLRHLEVGIDFVKSARSFDFALIAHFDTPAELDQYATHPVHIPVLNYLKSAAEQSVAVDYEF
jgi:hypothetical protein